MSTPIWEETKPVYSQNTNTQESLDQDPSWENSFDPEERFGGTSGELKAFGLGAARSASFGTSDEFLTRLNLIDPEDIKGYREQNPISSQAGEISGVIGAALAPEAGIAGILSTPVKGVAKLGLSASELIPAASQGASAAAKIATSAAQIGLGSAVEGSIYGLGQSISERALGDPDLNAEKVISNIGSGALIGGALGSLFGVAKGAYQIKYPKILSAKEKAALQEGNWEAIASAADVPEEEKIGFIKGLTKRKSNASEIESAAMDLGAPIMPSQVSDSKQVQALSSSLLSGPPTVSSLRAQAIAQEGFEKLQQSTQNVLNTEREITKATLGEDLKTIVANKIEEQAAPINALYDELKTRYEAIPTNPRSLNQVASNIRKIKETRLSPQAKSIAESAAKRLENLTDVDSIKELKSIINQELGMAATPIQKRITSIVADKLTDLEERTIVNFAENEMKTSTAKETILNLLNQRKQANSKYKVFKESLNKIGSVIGKKRVYGANDFLEFLESKTPEHIADRLSGKNNSEFLNWFSKEFPEAMSAISGHQKNLIKEASLKDGKFNISKVLSLIKKMPNEYKSKIFTPDELRKIQSIDTYFESFPKSFNPSNTANMTALRNFFENPFSAGVANIRDLAIENFINATSSGADKAKALVDGLSNIEKNALKITKKISVGSSAIFSQEGLKPAVRGYLSISDDDSEKEFEKVKSKIKDMSSNPLKMMDQLTVNTENLSDFAPKTAQGIQSTIIRATQFLNSKIPGDKVQKKPLSAPYKPSKAELSKWNKYFSTVENPTIVLDQIANGSILSETMETLYAVYPKLLNEMQVSVTDKLTEAITKNKVIPYRTKISLSLFLGTNLVNSLEPASILSTQNMLSDAMSQKKQVEQMSSVKKGSSDIIKQSNRLMMPLQKSAQRGDA